MKFDYPNLFIEINEEKIDNEIKKEINKDDQ